MKKARWCLLLALAIVFVSLSGCKSMPKVLYRKTYNRLIGTEQMVKDQDKRILALINDKDALTNELANARSLLDNSSGAAQALAEKDQALAAQRQALQDANARIAELEARGPGKGPEIKGVDVIYNTMHVTGLRIQNQLLFDSGQAELKAGSKKMLEQVAQLELVQDPKNILRICGFTDSSKISQSGWKDNFQLSGERARAVLNALAQAGVDANRMHFAGFGEHMLIMKDGKEDKAKSRRVEIYVITPQTE